MSRKITIELEIEDEPLENHVPTEEEKRMGPCSWRICGRCGGTVFHALTREPMRWYSCGETVPHPYYNADADQASVALTICMGCKKLWGVQ